MEDLWVMTSLPVKRPTRDNVAQLPVAHAHTQGNPIPVALSVMRNDTFGTTTIVVVQNVPIAHAHAITSAQGHFRSCDFR